MSPLRGFLLRTLAWLPVCFAAWYFLSILFTLPLAALVETALGSTFPAVFRQVVPDGNVLVVLSQIQVSAAGDQPGELMFRLNPLMYGYALPLYTALVLATDGDDLGRLLYWLLGMAVLVSVQVFGIATEALKIIAFELGDDGRAALDLAPWGYDALALAYQLGYLILPPVVPIMLWLGQFGQTQIGTLLTDQDGV
ncbi:MAG: hypothetical protein EA400_18455 [Chromatiaceae bacterium]|nr:MAG: hypothetical protein EA400_18455 [Chromatiaceae bacterium]